jgi:hypothetical protein
VVPNLEKTTLDTVDPAVKSLAETGVRSRVKTGSDGTPKAVIIFLIG